MKLKVVIPSKGRARWIKDRAFGLFPDAIVTVDESEMDDYLKVVPREQLLPHPPLPTLPHIRNWLLDNVHADVVVTCDDDVPKVINLVGWRARTYRDPNVCRQVLESAAVCAIDAGCSLFGFNLRGNPRFFDSSKPFTLNHGGGVVVGFVGEKGQALRCDPATWLFEDMDFAMQGLLEDRMIWSDDRWHFPAGGVLPGGSQRGAIESEAHRRRVEAAVAAMHRRWGQFFVRSSPEKWFSGRPNVQRTSKPR